MNYGVASLLKKGVRKGEVRIYGRTCEKVIVGGVLHKLFIIGMEWGAAQIITVRILGGSQEKGTRIKGGTC